MIRNLINKVGDVRQGEWRALAWSALLFFLILAGYYLVRPVRDAIAAEFPRDVLGDLFWITLGATLIANPILALLAVYIPRRILVPIAYSAFVALLTIVFFAMRAPDEPTRLLAGRTLYIGVSVLNLFLMTLFWALMADGYSLSRSKRLFGIVAAAGTLGAVCGAFASSRIVSIKLAGHEEQSGPALSILAGAVLIALTIPVSFLARRAMSDMPPAPDEALGNHDTDARKPVGGHFLAGFVAIARSPLLAGIACYLFFIPFAQTLVYFQQVDVIKAADLTREEATKYLASVDVWVNTAALVIQLFLTSRIIKWITVGGALVTLPVASCAGVAALAYAPSLTTLAVVRVAQRAVNYALARPARETLFTVVSPEDRFKAKPVIDTFIYRAADGVGERADKSLADYLLYLVPPMLIIWSAIAVTLGALQRRRVREAAPHQLCPNCRYDMRGITSDICPECGKSTETSSIP